MNAKEYLNQIRDLDTLIDVKCKTRAQLEIKAQQVSSPELKERVLSSGTSGFAQTVDKIVDLDNEISQQIDDYQICVPKDHKINSFDGDAVQHFGSYGAEQDLIEVYGFFLNEPKGFLTVDEALKYFIEWEKQKNKSDT